MKTASRLFTWFPPFVVGLSAAVAGELAVGLLLYSTPGFLPALTLILAVLLGSLALGLWTAPAPSEDAYGESLRRRWLLTLISFAGGSAASGYWSVQRGLAADTLSRGVGLALLAALPLYACGALLGAMPSRRWPWVRNVPVAASAMAGAALGIMLAGYVLVSVLLPVSIYAFCLVLLSGGALVHGLILTASGERRVMLTSPSQFGRVRIEDWSWGKKVHPIRILLENERVRGAEDSEGWPARRWEDAALDLASRSLRAGTNGASSDSASAPIEAGGSSTPPPAGLRTAPAGLLVLGGGMFTLARQVLGRHDDVRVDVAERNPAILEAGPEHFGLPKEHPRLRVVRRDPLSSLEVLPGPYRVTLVDRSGLPFSDPVPLPARSFLESLRDRTAPGGIVMLGGLERGVASGMPLERLMSEGGSLFPTVALYGARTEPGPVTRNQVTAESASAKAGELLLVFSSDANADFTPDLRGLRLETVQRTVVTDPVDIDTLR